MPASQRRPVQTRPPGGWVWVVLGMLWIGGCSQPKPSGRPVTVEKMSLTPSQRWVGVFFATRVEPVFSAVDGTVARAFVKEGDTVLQGDILVELVKAPVEASLAKASDEATLKALNWAKEACDVRAPMAGKVLTIHVSPGNVVAGQWGTMDEQPLISLLPADAPLELRVLVPSAYAKGVAAGTSVRIGANGREGDSHEARIASVTEKDTMIQWTIDYPPTLGWDPEPNQNVKVDLASPPTEPVPVVPVEALKKKGDDWIVTVQRQGGAGKDVAVTLGRGDERWVEVLSGVAPGDVVVCPGM